MYQEGNISGQHKAFELALLYVVSIAVVYFISRVHLCTREKRRFPAPILFMSEVFNEWVGGGGSSE